MFIKRIQKILLWVYIFLFLVTCSGGGGSPTEPVTPDPPVPSFTFTPTSGYAPLTVQFTSTSTGQITSHAWDFQNNLTIDSSDKNPSYVYTEAGVYSIRLTVTGPGGTTYITQENSLTVLQAEAPAVENVSQTTDEDVPISITLSGTDPQDFDLTFSVGDTGPSNGTVDININTLTYTPDPNWNGTETFTYRANNGYLDSNEGVVTIQVNAIDDEPNTLDVSATTDEDTAISIVLNADEVDGDSYSFAILSPPQNGSASLSGNNVVYTPNTNWHGVDTFTFEATDDRVMLNGKVVNTGTATITVNPVNDAPVADNISATTTENVATDIALSASDIEGDNLTYTIVDNPGNGNVSINGSTASYNPSQDWNGTDTFTYKVNDGTDDSNTATVTITVEPANTAPVAENQTLTTDEDISASLNLSATDVNGDNLTYSVVDNPSNGSVSISGSSATYSPNNNWNGTDSFTWRANDGSLDSNTATVTVTVAAVNDSPTSQNVSVSFDTRTASSINITLSATDPEGDSITYSIVSDVSNGTTSLSGSSVTYTPTSGFEGTDTFTYKANDGTLDGNTATVDITVDAEDAPTTNDVSGSTNEDTAIDITLDGSDDDGDTLTYSVVTTPSNGVVSISGSVATYTPAGNFNGTDTFTYNANDGTSDSNTSTVTVTVNAVNDAPITISVSGSGNEDDSAINVTLSGSDIDGDALTYSIISDASNGSTSLSGSTVTYTPDADWNGTDTFTYNANDGTDDSNTSTVTITVAAVNDAPTTEDVSATFDENRTASRLDAIILQGSDVDGDDLTYTIVSGPSNGNASIAGSFLSYAANQDWNGTETITYKANDGSLDSNTSTVTITVNAVNDAPTTEDVSASTDEDTAVDITLDGNDVDSETNSDNLTYSIVSDVSNGSTSISGKTVTYTPDANWNGTDTFTYKANDGSTGTSSLDSNISTVTITVAAVNDAPVANNVTASTDENRMMQLSITLDASDVDGDALTYSIVDDVSNGTTSLSGSTVTYTPDDDWNGTDTFTYNANDGTVDSNTATVTITVNAVNDAPTTEDVSASTDEDTAFNITLDGSDVDSGDTLTYSIVSDASNGSTSLSGSTVTYTPDADWNGTDTFTYNANDGTDDSNTSTVTITVAAVNDAPVANNVTASTDENRMMQLSITLDASDVDGDALTYSVVSDVSDGSTSLSGSTVTYTPDDDWNGTDTFTYNANDGTVDSNTATVTITVAAVNDAPTTRDASGSTDEDTAVDITLDGSDVDGDDLTYSIVSDASNGSTLIGADIVTYTPDADWNGTDTFTYKANDGTVDSNTSTMTITVAAVNDAPVTDDDTASTNEDTDVTIELEATDTESDNVTFSIVSDPSNGSIGLSGSTAVYTPDADWNGTDTFTYNANDGTDDSNTSTVTITVAAVNDIPVTKDISYSPTSTAANADNPSAAIIDEDNSFTYDLTNSTTDVEGDNLTFTIDSDPSNGTASISGSTITYTPDADWNGIDTMDYIANDGTDDSNTSTIVIQVTAVQDAPTTNDMSVSTDEDVAVNVALDGSDVDSGDTLTYSIVSDASNGSTSLSGSTVTYTPDDDWNGTDTFTYNTNDGTDDSNTSTVTITVAAVNDAPVISDMADSASEDNDANWSFGNAVDTSIDIDGDTMTYSIVSNGSNGTASVTLSNSEYIGSYTPDANWNGTDTFTFKANDGTTDSNTATFTVTVTSVEDSPVTEDVSASTDEDTAVDITLDGSDADSGDTLTYAIVSDVSNGSTSLSGSTVTYTPTADWNGTDTFTYKVNDGDEDSNTSTVTITVAAVNDAPTTEDVSTTIDENRTARTTGITLDGSDVDGDSLTYSLVTDPSNGTASVSGSTVTYTADQDWNGTETFTYKANDGTADSNTSTITITVTAVNDTPVVTDDSYINFNTADDYLSLDDSDGFDLRGGTGLLTLSFTYKLNSTVDETIWLYRQGVGGEFNIGIRDANDSDSGALAINTGIKHSNSEGWSWGTYDISYDNDIHNVTIVYDRDSGIRKLFYDYELVRTEAGLSTNVHRYNGQDARMGEQYDDNPSGGVNDFNIYKALAWDGTALSENTITTTGSNQTTISGLDHHWEFEVVNSTVEDLVGSNDGALTSSTSTGTSGNEFSTDEDTALDIDLSTLVSDVDGDVLTYSIESDVSNGTTSLSGSTVTYTPTADWNGNDYFTWNTNDGTVDSENSTVIIVVNAVNDAPVTDDDTASTDEDVAVDITLSSTDTEGDSVTYSIVTDVSNGSTSLSGSTVTYTPTADWNGTDTFTYKANDGTDDSNTSTMTITVAAVNDAPTLDDNSTVQVNEDESVSFSMTADDVENGDENNDMTYSIVSDPSNGTVSITQNTNGLTGVFLYTPDADYNGTDTFTMNANDGDDDSNTATITVTIAAINDLPVAESQTFTADEDNDVTIDLTTVVTDVDGDEIEYTVLADLSNGTRGNITNSTSTPTVTFTPDANWNGTETMTIRGNDGTGNSVDENGAGFNAIVTVVINAVNDTPTIADESATADEDVNEVEINPTITDGGSDEQSIASGTIVTDPSNGTITGSSFGNTSASITYQPDANWNGTDTFTYRVTDNLGVDSAIGTATITINAVQDAPTTEDVSDSTDEDVAVDITLDGSDADSGDTLTYSIVSDVSDGTTSLSGSTVTYTPDDNWNGTDTFTYNTNDGTDDSNTSTVTITVAAVNDGPTSDDEGITTSEDTPVRTGFSSSDIEGDTITSYEIVSQPSNGTASVDMNENDPGLYTPDANYNGTDTFTYRATDGTDWGNTATATVTISAVNDAPTTNDVSDSTDEDTPVDITLDGSDVDSGDTLTYSIVTDVSNGTTSLSGSTVTYTPTADWNGTETFTYKVNDGTVDSNTSTVTITVASVEDSPTTNDVSDSTDEDVAVDITLDGSDADSGDTLTYSIVSDVSNGTTSLSGSTVTYTPDANWNGTDTFTYNLNDGDEDSNTSTVTITVAAVNDAPTTEDVSASADEGNNALYTLDASDTENDDLTYILVSGPSNGTLNQQSGTSWDNPEAQNTYVPDSGFTGTDTFTYKVNDGTDDSNTSTVTITINPVNNFAMAFNGMVGNADNSTNINDHSVINYGEIDNTLGEAGDALTVSIWMYATEDPSRHVIVDVSNYGNANTPRYGRMSLTGHPANSNDGVFDAYVQSDQGGNFNLSTSVIPNEDEWYHLALVINPSDTSVRYYVNGSEEASRTDFDTTHTFTGTRNWQLGSISTAEAYHSFEGYLDEFAVWSTALTSTQIDSIYNSGDGGVRANEIESTSLEMYVNFEDETSTDIINDYSASQSSRTAITTATPFD